MSIESALEDIAGKLHDYGDTLETEEATKNALVMPFISNVLGYDVFNPHEVVPEFVADVGTKRGEKVDYAIMRDGTVQMLIEAKSVGAALSLENSSQLTRYFTACSAKIGVLTNGRNRLFYTDLDKANVMDSKPFLRLDLLEIDSYALPELKKLTRESFDLDSILAAAEELKYVSSVKAEVAKEFSSPSPEMIRLLAKRVYDGSFTAKIQAAFEQIVAKAMRQYISEQVNSRLKIALNEGAHDPEPRVPSEDVAEAVEEIHTTQEELEAFMIVKAILVSEVDLNRVVARDRKTYFGVLLDDNNRKPICRFHFNAESVKYLETFDADKKGTKHQIFSLNDIYKYVSELRDVVHNYQ